VFLDGAVEPAQRHRQLGGRNHLFRAPHRGTQRGDRPQVARDTFHFDVALLLEDRDTVFNDEIGGRREGRHAGKGDGQAWRDANTAQRHPAREAGQLAFEQFSTSLEHLPVPG
jgi:hypothetical protein